MNDGKFILNSKEFIFLECDDVPIQEISYAYILNVIWSDNNKKTNIGRAYSFDIADELIQSLSAALRNELFFDEQLYLDLGLLWDMCNNPEEAQSVVVKYAVEQGLRADLSDEKYMAHLLFSAYPHKKTFMYNNQLGEIILLVAPQFVWPDDPKDADYWDTSESTLKQYLDFLKNYKPFLKIVVPSNVARQWLLQAEKLGELFRKNEFENCLHCEEASNIEIDFEKHPNGLYHDRTTKE